MKRISDTAPGQRLSAWVVLSPGGNHVATIRALCSTSGLKTSVEVWALVDGLDGWQMQTGEATGGGYDKLTAALAGLHIGSFTFIDHRNYVKGDPRAGLDGLRDAGFKIIQAL